MNLKAKAASVFGYRVAPTSILAFITYLAVLVALVVTDILPNAPSVDKQGGLDANEAYEDLRHITAHPHPYNSHANDHVRNYILSRIVPLTDFYPHVHISDDLVSNGSWTEPGDGVYFEGTNILVKVDGVDDSEASGVLFSAHYDSVSTGHGTTDNGMGVVTMLQLIYYFAENRAKRTAVFNINNGEEDWLNGAHAFLEHPWSSLTDTFLNLEGTGPGGRPILFQATSMSVVRASRNVKLVPHPHANVISSDAFSLGVIPSDTDFSVYAGPGSKAGMDGLDVAFYKRRSRYHTKYDAVQHTLGAKKSMWSMMEVARGIGIGLLNAPPQANKSSEGSVYFDLFKTILIVFPLAQLLTFNVVILIIGPIMLIILLACEKLIFGGGRNTHRAQVLRLPPSASTTHVRSYLDEEEHDAVHSQVVGEEQPSKFRRLTLATWRHAKFWVTLIVIVAFQFLLGLGFVSINPFTVYSSPFIVLCSFISLAYLCLVNTLTLPSSIPYYHPKSAPNVWAFGLPAAQQQKHTIFLHLYFFTWLLLVLSTLGITRIHPGLGSGYIISAWNICVAASCVVAALEGIVISVLRKNEGGESSSRNIRWRFGRHLEDADESTPLMYNEGGRNVHSQSDTPPLPPKKEEDGGSLGTLSWIPQFLLSVPIPVILFGQICMILLDGVPQTLADGSPAWIVYAMISSTAVILILPLAPFAYKLRASRTLSRLVFGLFILSTVYAWLVFPFSITAPLKVYFQQRLEFPQEIIKPFSETGGLPRYQTSSPPKVITSLTGPRQYLRNSVVPHLPSSQYGGKGIWCNEEKTGLVTCEWESGFGMMPVPGAPSYLNYTEREWDEGEFFKAFVERTGPSSARFFVKGKNTRSCKVYFDNAPVYNYYVHPPQLPRRFPKLGDDEEHADGDSTLHNNNHNVQGRFQEGYEIGPDGIKLLRMWSRTWDREFRVDVHWAVSTNNNNSRNGVVRVNELDSEERKMKGRIGCEWTEYETGMVDDGSLLRAFQSTNLELGKGEEGESNSRAKIPAFEEVLAFLPEWVVVTKAADGLVEAWAPFDV